MPRPALTHCNKGRFRKTAASLFIALLGACDTATPAPKNGPAPESLQASTMDQVRRLHIANGECTAVLRDTLGGHGYRVHQTGPADASLKVILRDKRPLRDQLPVIETLGWQANYRAELIGADNTILLSLYGQEGSLTFKELCDDIGDEIADKLEEYLPDRD